MVPVASVVYMEVTVAGYVTDVNEYPECKYVCVSLPYGLIKCANSQVELSEDISKRVENHSDPVLSYKTSANLRAAIVCVLPRSIV